MVGVVIENERHQSKGYVRPYYFEYKILALGFVGGSSESPQRLLLAFCANILGGGRDL